MALRVVARRYQAATVETRGDARRGEDRPRAFDARRAGRTVQPDRRASDPHGAGAVTGGMGRALQTCRGSRADGPPAGPAGPRAPAHRSPDQAGQPGAGDLPARSEEHTSELQSLMRISYAVFCLKKKKY